MPVTLLGLGPKKYLEIPVGTNWVENITTSHQKHLWWAQDVLGAGAQAPRKSSQEYHRVIQEGNFAMFF